MKKPTFKKPSKEDLIYAWKHAPLILAKKFFVVFLTGAVLSLLVGGYYFYKEAYTITVSDYEAFVRAREINSKMLTNALEFIEEQKSSSITPAGSDAFNKPATGTEGGQ